MKKSHIAILVIVFVIITTLMSILTYFKDNWWFLGAEGIALALGLITILLVLGIKKYTQKDKPKEKERGVKIAKISSEECLKIFEEELKKPYYADMMDYLIINDTKNYGTEDLTPINVIGLKGVHEDSVEYWRITNLANPENPTIILYHEGKDRKEFEEELEKIKNMKADVPEKVEKITRTPIRDPLTGEIRIKTTKEKMSKERADELAGEEE